MANELTKTEIKEIKISQNKLDEFSDEITNATEIIESSMKVLSSVSLTKHTINGDFDEWKKQQKIVRVKLNKELTQSVKNSQIIIKNVINNTMSNIGNAVENLTEETKKKVETNKKETIKLISNAEKGIKLLGKKILSDYDKKVANVYKLRNQEPLFEAILKQTQEGIDKAPYKIAYRDGKEFSFKSYMEMNVRTTVRQEANQLLFNASKMNGVVFYICSFFGDCAKDHANHQGLYYFDEDWTTFGYDEETSQKIQDYIDGNNLSSYQKAIDDVGLTTRPNCRHSFRPVVLTDIIEENKSANQMLGEYKIIKGSYNDQNYIDLQTQRKNERALRFYKSRLEEHKLQAKNNPADPTIKNLIDKDIKLIKKWNSKQNDLLSSNKLLKRDTRRENNKVLVQDLGAGYQLGLKIDGKNMYVKEKVKKS